MLSSKRMFIYVAIVIVSVVCNYKAEAQRRGFATKGTTELAGTVSFSTYTPVSGDRTGDATSLFTFAPQVGYFVSDGLELGLSTGFALLPGVTVITPSSGKSTTFTQLFFSPSYNFQTKGEDIFPFIEGQLGYTAVSSGNYTESGLSYGGRGGIKIVAAEHFLITPSVQYLAITLNREGATTRTGFNYLVVGVGVAGYF